MLLARDVDVTQVSQDGLLPVYNIFQSEPIPSSTPHKALLELYFSDAATLDLINLQTSFGLTLLTRCAAYGPDDAVQYLLDRGSSTEIQSKEQRWTPIFAAIAYNPCLNVLEKLLKYSSPNSLKHRDVRGWTPLHLAAATGKSDFVELLLEHGSDPDALSIASDNEYVPEAMRNLSLTPAEVAKYAGPAALEAYLDGMERSKRRAAIHRDECNVGDYPK